MNEDATAVALVAAVLAVIGLLLGWLWRAGRRQRERERAALLAAPVASFDLDAATLRAFALWQAGAIEVERAAMLRRAVKISLWLLSILIVAFTALGAARTSWQSGAAIGAAFSGFIIGPLWTVCGGLALLQTRRARQLRHSAPVATRMLVGTQGIAFEGGDFQQLHGAPYAAHMLPGPPLVLELITRYSGGKSTRYLHARGPIPAADTAAGWAALKQLRQRWNLPPQ